MKNFFFILMILFGTFARAGRVELINDASQISVSNIGSGIAGNLIDNNVSSTVISKTGELDDFCYIRVDLQQPLALETDEDLVIYLQRCDKNENEANPTIFKVEGSEDGETWGDWDDGIQSCHVYFLYRGPKTKEYSTRIRTTRPFRYLRFTVTANSGRRHDSSGHRYMCLSEFQIYRLGRNDNYSVTWIDRLHINSDYYKKLRDYGFENTQGILDERNRAGGRDVSVSGNWADWNAWADGKWTKDSELLEKAGIEMPDYAMLTSDNDDGSGYRPDAGQQRQPSHVTEHVLYAIPGDAIALYPYYSFTTVTNYLVNFAHWYDYKTGGHLNVTDESTGKTTAMLDFLTDPAGVHKNNQYGYFASKELNKELPAISTPEEYIAFARSTKYSGNEKQSVRIVNDLDFSGYTDVPSICEGGWFSGTIDGEGHRIMNLKMIRDGQSHVGLIASAGNGCEVRNLIIDESCTFQGKDKVAALLSEEVYGQGIKIESVECYATVTATDGVCAALIAHKDSENNNSPTTINNCYVGGLVSGTTAAAVAIWREQFEYYGKYYPPNFRINNTVSTATVNSGDMAGTPFAIAPETSVVNCYYGTSLPQDLNSSQFVTDLGQGWAQGSGSHVVPVLISPFVASDSKYGKVATFFCPGSPYADDGVLQELPFRSGENEFVIAADFSQSFSPEHNLDETTKTIIEPVIQFRHIFRIRDGKTFAESFSGSEQANREYVRKNLRRVSSRAGAAFQIRLDSPIPQKGTTRSKYYYKISDTDYRRVCTMNIEVTDLATGQVRKTIISSDGTMVDENGNAIMSGSAPADPTRFYYGEDFDGEGSRTIEGIKYNMCGGGGKYYRMLKCNNPQVGRYLIRITGNDINGTPIKIFGSESPLVVMEMELTVMPEKAASLVDEETLYGDEAYSHAREEVLEDTYGAPRQRLTFDEYTALETLPNRSDYLEGSNHAYKYKWPMPWESVTYSFDYNEQRDFNMYTVASHSSKTGWNAAASKYVNPDGSKGLYDRLYYKTQRHGQTVKYGYFYYINASVDPGVMARLNMQDLCMGSTIHVSAWIAEFSEDSEVANISFNFIAVLKDAYGKDRVPLHSFITGYVPRDKLGKWMNVYYSFVPNYTETGLTPDMIDHYELELENNCKKSSGADYAVDNIRLYVASPILYASQRDPVCNDNLQEMTVTIETPFDVMLQVLGEQEADAADGRTTDLYYTFIDKKKFDSKYAAYIAAGDPEPGQKAYTESVLRYNYDNGGTGDQTYGKVHFNLNFASNPAFDKDNSDIRPEGCARTEDDGTRLITFNTRPADSKLMTGKEYYVSIYPAVSETEITPAWSEFDINDPCARMCVFRVRPASVIKVDGEVREDTDNIICCENQSPVVQVDIWGKNGEMNEMEPVEKNARLDWYNGSYESFVSEQSEAGTLLSDALAIFRSVYADAGECNVEPAGDLTEEMIEYLKKMSTEIPEGTNCPLLSLSQSSFVFPPTVIPPGEDHCYLYVVAIPISSHKESVLLCTVPTEVRMRVQNIAPVLNHGLRSGITYPENMTDVPLRIGLRHLQEVSAPESNVKSHEVRLMVPVRSVRKASEEATAMTRIIKNPYILLVGTNDPEYKDLGTVDPDGEDTGALMRVGEISLLKANVVDSGNENIFQAVFYDSFRFKEGYYYRMRFMFEENASDISSDDEMMCLGQDVFTIKVVPEYQRWVGDVNNVSRNWNNDANWERVGSADLYLTEERKDELDDFVTDGSANANKRSYAPLEFTKVIIPPGSVFPHLGVYQYSDIPASDYTNLKNIKWTDNPSDDISGSATEGIQFDMAAYKSSKWDVACRPWYANTCGQIHFMPKSEITGQENLIYEKAWVDIAVTPGRWYTLSTPLQTVYAGDMYLPSGSGRQETEMFSEITFDAQKNNRFRPAVYQRGWDKSSATVYEIKDGPTRSVAVKADWSNVYNDVMEKYGGGTGFSIKTDASKIGSVDEVLFRLPKSDTFFDYYSEDGLTVGNRTPISRNSGLHFRLNNIVAHTPNNKIIARNAGSSRYFLVGNPLMAHLDMREFFEVNKGKITPKYWILTDGSQKVGVFDDTADGFVGSADGFVAPMQGFFVEARNGEAWGDGNDMVLELNYSASMACIASFDNSPLKIRSRSGYDESNKVVTISAIRDNRLLSQTFINYSPLADMAYDEADDAVMIDNSSLEIPVEVYTVAGNMALSVNTTSHINGTEVGLISVDDDETELVFEGIGAIADVSLYDAVTQTRIPLSEGMRYTVEGNVSGRLYLLSDSEAVDDMLKSINVRISGGSVRVEAGKGDMLDAKVYTADGIMVLEKIEDSPVTEFTLDKGFYILVASDGIDTVKHKILIL